MGLTLRSFLATLHIPNTKLNKSHFLPFHAKKIHFQKIFHCVKILQIRIFFWSVFSRIRTEYGPEKTPYLDTFHAVFMSR